MIRKADTGDLTQLALLACGLWPSHTAKEMEEEFLPLLKDPNAFIALAQEGGIAIGFAQCQIRNDYVEGSSGSPVAYLEGIYIIPSRQRGKHGSHLVKACEQWAIKKGCAELASDCELANTDSLAFHLGTGFKEAGRIICFIKSLES